MTRILATILLCLVLKSLSFGKNWNIIEPGIKYNYSKDSIIRMTIWVDSVYLMDEDTVFILNKVHTDCESCSLNYLSYAVYLKNQPTFLQYRIIKNEVDLDNQWLFDSLNHKYAKYVRKEYMNIFDDISDSVKIITIDGHDTLIISENFGIIRYPDFTGKDFVLLGVEGNRQAGKRNLYFEDFFNPATGDIFQYKVTTGYRFPGTEEIQKCLVQSVEESTDTIFINTAMVSRKIFYAHVTPTDTIYSASDHKFTYSRKDLWFLDQVNYQNLSDRNPISVGFDETYECSTKSYTENFILAIGDTLYSSGYPGYYPFDSDSIKYYRYGSKIGLLWYYNAWHHDGQYHAHYSITLQGYSSGSTTYGEIYPDSFFYAPGDRDYTNGIDSTLLAEGFKIFPTAFSREISITFKDLVMKASMEIYDMNGNLLYRKVMTNVKTVVIDPGDLSNGMYFLNVSINNKRRIPIKIIKI